MAAAVYCPTSSTLEGLADPRTIARFLEALPATRDDREGVTLCFDNDLNLRFARRGLTDLPVDVVEN